MTHLLKTAATTREEGFNKLDEDDEAMAARHARHSRRCFLHARSPMPKEEAVSLRLPLVSTASCDLAHQAPAMARSTIIAGRRAVPEGERSY